MQRCIFYDSSRYILQFGLGGIVNTAEEEKVIIIFNIYFGIFTIEEQYCIHFYEGVLFVVGKETNIVQKA